MLILLKMRKFYFFALISFFCFACTSAPKTAGSNISFGKLTYIIEQLEPSIWPEPLKGSSKMFITFSVEYFGKINENPLSKLVVESPAGYWVASGKDLDKIIDYDDKYIIFKRLQCGEGAGKVPLGEWTVSLFPKNSSKKTEKKINVAGFANTDKDKKENFPDEIKAIVPNAGGKGEISALAVPVIKSVSRDEDSIEVFFSVSDSRIKNGYFWFDVPGEKYYKDSGSMIDASEKPVNGCRKFSVDGNECHLVFRKDNNNKEWFDKALACFFVVSDVNRVAAPWDERIRTVSAKAVIK